MEETVYRENLIVKFGEKDAMYYLYDADGDIVERHAKSVEDAKEKIDAFYEEHGGFYNEEGKLYTE